jgi:glycosyltransferase involved in cell wall biosynthesis
MRRPGGDLALPRVLCVTGAYAPEFSAGGLQCQAVARLLRQQAHFHVLTTATDPSLAAEDVVEGVAVSRVGVDLSQPGAMARSTPRMLASLLRLVPTVDLIHIQGFSQKNVLVSMAGRTFRRPIVMSLHTARHDEAASVVTQGRLAWWAFSTADLYLSVSPGLSDAYLSAGLAPDRLRQVPNGVDLARFSPAAADRRLEIRRRLGLPADRPLVLFVGILSRDKQPHILFDAWASLQREPSLASTLVFVGPTSPRQFEADADLADEIRDRAGRLNLGDRVRFVPPTHDVHDYFRAADIYVLPSAREGLPVALLEAMASGLPSIASRLPGSTDVIVADGTNGLLVPPGDSAGFASALDALLRDPERAHRLGVAARQTVEERYSMARVAEAWLAAYDDVLGRRTSRPTRPTSPTSPTSPTRPNP